MRGYRPTIKTLTCSGMLRRTQTNNQNRGLRSNGTKNTVLVNGKRGKPVDDAAALLGALVSLNDLSRDNPKWLDWKIRGQELLNRKNSDGSA